MSFNNFANSLGNGFFHTIAGRGPIEFVDGEKPVKGNQNRFIAGDIETSGPFHGKRLIDFTADIQIF